MGRLSVLLAFLIVMACSTKPTAPNKFSDSVLVRIYDLQDRRLSDSLLFFLQSTNPVYRRAAALAFGSVQDSVASLSLGTALLEDPDLEVRINAAYSLGQTGGAQAVNALIPALEDKDRRVVREVLEGLGKTVQIEELKILCDFQSNDTLQQEGQSWAFYRLAVRKKADSMVTKKISKYLLSENSYQARLAAAQYFGRSSKVEGTGFQDNLINAALHDLQPNVRMAAVSGFRHLDIAGVLPVLKNIYTSDRDYRVRASAVRVCLYFPLDITQEIVFDALKDSVEILQVAASEVLRSVATKNSAKRISKDITETKSLRAKANLYAALLKSSSSDGIVDEIKALTSTAPTYFKAALLSALGDAIVPLDKEAFEFLSEELLNESNTKVALTSAASAIVAINRRVKEGISKKEFLRIYELAIAQGDVAVIGIISSALTNESLHYKEEVKDLSFLYNAKAKFSLPKDIESLQPLEEAIAYLEGREEPKPLRNEFNHPIDWKLVKTIPSGQRVEIKTTKGNVVMRMLVDEAPGSVSNFVELINKKYFDGKFFHRVVPNFVIQTGCNRGDGYGSEDFSIRSEFSGRQYTTGSVGMASAGKDTEGTQWFITHSPTPHLDGKYTIFAVVESGMEVVHRMDVGDQMLEVRLI